MNSQSLQARIQQMMQLVPPDGKAAGLGMANDGRVIVRSHSKKKRIMKRPGFYDSDAYC